MLGKKLVQKILVYIDLCKNAKNMKVTNIVTKIYVNHYFLLFVG
jgi:hypothetical protein